MFSPDPVFHSVIPALRAILNAAWYASLSVSMGRAEVRRPARRPPLSHAARWPRRLRSLLLGRRCLSFHFLRVLCFCDRSCIPASLPSDLSSCCILTILSAPRSSAGDFSPGPVCLRRFVCPREPRPACPSRVWAVADSRCLPRRSVWACSPPWSSSRPPPSRPPPSCAPPLRFDLLGRRR